MAGSGLTGFIQNIGTGEMLVIAVVALVVLGPERLPEMARSAGRMLHKLKTMSSDLQSQMGDVMSDPAMQPIRELGELATRPRQKLSEYMLEAEAEQRAAKGTDAAIAAEESAADEPAAPAHESTTASGPTAAGDAPTPAERPTITDDGEQRAARGTDAAIAADSAAGARSADEPDSDA